VVATIMAEISKVAFSNGASTAGGGTDLTA
jgi:hypothetical protein